MYVHIYKGLCAYMYIYTFTVLQGRHWMSKIQRPLKCPHFKNLACVRTSNYDKNLNENIPLLQGHRSTLIAS